jgi:hypothetical protein
MKTRAMRLLAPPAAPAQVVLGPRSGISNSTARGIWNKKNSIPVFSARKEFMEKVNGMGGLFLRANDPDGLACSRQTSIFPR